VNVKSNVTYLKSLCNVKQGPLIAPSNVDVCTNRPFMDHQMLSCFLLL
jgi:hypothetical protein